MIEIEYLGRLGNNLIQYAAGYILARETGLSLNTAPKVQYKHRPRIKINFGDIFNIENPIGESYIDTMELDDTNYYKYLSNPKQDTGYKLNGFFQDGRLLCEYRDDILNLYQYKMKTPSTISQDDAFVSCRFGDLLFRHRTYCTIEYIEKQLKLKRHNYRDVYITSDSLNHPPLIELVKNYNLTLYDNNPLDTILFAKGFNNLILSAGSFNYWIAYLSDASNIVVYKNKKHDKLQLKNAWEFNQNVKFTF